MLPKEDDKKPVSASQGENNKDEAGTGKDETIYAAREQADKDIDKDPDLSIHSPNDDLDEGETARLGDDKNDLI